MGAVLSDTIGQLTADRHWNLRDLAPLPHLTPLSGVCDADEQSALSYASECLHAVKADGWSKSKSIQWRIPESVNLAGICSCDASAVADVLERLVSALSSYRLVAFSVDGHSEVTAADVHQWASRLGPNVVALAPASLWSNVRVANLSDCCLGDAGVQAFFSIVFPAATTTSAASQEGSGHAVSTPYRALLPLLESLVLDGVGLTDHGAVWMASHLNDVARCMQGACLNGGRDDASVTPNKRCLLRSLSLQRNRLGAVGVVRLLHACVVHPPSACGANRRAIEAVDFSWNSLAPVSGGGAIEQESGSVTRRKLLSALGADMVRSAPEGPCLTAAAVAAAASPQPRIPLLLKGCGADEADVRALCTEGLLFTILECLREAARSEMHDPPNSPARNLSVPSLCTLLTKIDLSHSPYLGDAGVRQLLSAFLCLEATRGVSCKGRHRRDSMYHSFCVVEEVLLREVGCTDAVLTDVVRLLISNIDQGFLGSGLCRSATGDLINLGTVFEEDIHRSLLSEARLLSGIRPEEVQESTENVENDDRMTSMYLPFLRLLDLSENSFSSAALVSAAMAGAALRASFLVPCAPGSGAMGCRAGYKHEGFAPPRTGLSAGPEEEGFALGLEECGLADTVLAQFPLSLELLRAELPECQEPPFSLADCSASVAPQHAARPRSRRCTWYLGGNHLTQSAILRLRHFTEILVQRTSVGSQLCPLDAYVERNAILYPATSVEESEEDAEGKAAATADSAALWRLGITAIEDDIPGSGIDERAASASKPAFSGRYSALNDFTRPRVSWDQLPSLPTFADVEDAHYSSPSSIAPHLLQRGPSRTPTTALSTCLHHSGFSGSPRVAVPKTRSARAGAPLSRCASGGLDLSLSHTDGAADTSAYMAHFYEDAASRPSPLSMPESSIDFMDAFLAEAEHAFLERRTFVERIGRQVAAAEIISCFPPLPLPDSDGELL